MMMPTMATGVAPTDMTETTTTTVQRMSAERRSTKPAKGRTSAMQSVTTEG